MPVKVLDASGEGSYADVIEGILWAVDNEARVLNLSLGGYAYSQFMADAVDYAHAGGAVLVAASGNEATSAPLYPAAFPSVIGVSATDSSDRIWAASNSGPYIKLSAPGVDILSAGLANGYVTATGTSLAAAHVSGVAALIFSSNLDLSRTQVEQILYQTADDLGEKGKDEVYGHGRVNAATALGMASIEVHDVAVVGIRVEPRTFQIGEAAQIIVSVQNQGTFVENNLLIDVSVNAVPAENARKIQFIKPGEDIDVSFAWMPGVSSPQRVTVRGEVSTVPGEDDVTDNERVLDTTLTQQDGSVTVQYKQSTHQWIGFEAALMLPSSSMEREIRDFLGSFGGDCSGTALEDGSTLLEGMYEEDCDVHFLKHFWDPDNDTDLAGLSGDNRAVSYAEVLIGDATDAYHRGDRNQAYYLLGRVAHLLEDMAQPAHVHNDDHLPSSNDDYEGLVSAIHSRYRYDQPRDPEDTALISFLTEGEGYPLQPIDYETLPFTIDNSGSRNYPETRNTPLFRLFFNLAETADFFESEDEPGDIDHIQYDQLASTISWHQIGQLPPDLPQSIDEPTLMEARAHADVLIPLAIRYVGGLYQFFWDTTHFNLTNEQGVADSVSQNTWKFYTIEIPPSATSLTITTSNTSGNVDLYVKHNQTPTSSVYDCRPGMSSGNEQCSFSFLLNGTWIIGVKGVATGIQTYVITATYTTPLAHVITNVIPSTLPAMPLPQTQLLSVYGSGFLLTQGNRFKR